MKLEHLTVETFRQKITDDRSGAMEFLGERPAVVDFYADWCGPCKAVSPILESLADKYKGAVDIYKVNVETEPELAAGFKIYSIPTILFLSKKSSPNIIYGAQSEEELDLLIQQLLDIEEE